jgi:general secretion pathway protein E/type IV pilus assembly protein PilB
LAPDAVIPEDIGEEMASALRIPLAEVKAFHGAGCIECNQKGYRGRVAVYEFFVMTEDVADLLGPNLRTGQLRAAARQHGWRSLRQQGWSKVQNGLVSIAEVQRLTWRIKQPGLELPDAAP